MMKLIFSQKLLLTDTQVKLRKTLRNVTSANIK